MTMEAKERGTQTKSILVGTFNTPELFHLVFDPRTESLTLADIYPAHGNHSWLALGPTASSSSSSSVKQHRNLYATAWTDPTSVAAYRITQDQDHDKQLTLVLQNTAPTRARSGYVAVGKQPANVLYTVGGPTGEVLRLDESDGSFVTEGATLQYLDFIHGHVQRATPQSNGIAAPNTTLERGKTMDFGGLRNGSHSIDLSPDGRLAFVADIGRNAIFVYEVDAKDGGLTLAQKKASPRSNDGPRHVWPHPGGEVVYVLQEHSCVVDVFEVVRGRDPSQQATSSAEGEAQESGAVHLALRQSVRIIPDDLDEKLFWADEVRTSPITASNTHPQFLFASTRGLEPQTRGYVALYALDERGYLRDVSHSTESDSKASRAKWMDLLQTPTSGGWANAIEPCHEALQGDQVYAALTDSEEGLVMILKVDKKGEGGKGQATSLKEVARVELGNYKDTVRGAATAVWL